MKNAACSSVNTSCLQMGDHGVSGQHKYQLEEAQRAEKRVSLLYQGIAACHSGCTILSPACAAERVAIDTPALATLMKTMLAYS